MSGRKYFVSMMGTLERHGLVFHGPVSPSRGSKCFISGSATQSTELTKQKCSESQGHGAGPSRSGPDVQVALGGFAISLHISLNLASRGQMLGQTWLCSTLFPIVSMSYVGSLVLILPSTLTPHHTHLPPREVQSREPARCVPLQTSSPSGPHLAL